MFGLKIVFIFSALLVLIASFPLEQEEEEEVKNDGPKDYSFKYVVDDHHTGDHKSHEESVKGGVVKGHYSLKEADGTLREVHYTADKDHGFTAVVKKSGTPLVQEQHKYELQYPYPGLHEVHHHEPIADHHLNEPFLHQHYGHAKFMNKPVKYYEVIGLLKSCSPYYNYHINSDPK